MFQGFRIFATFCRFRHTRSRPAPSSSAQLTPSSLLSSGTPHSSIAAFCQPIGLALEHFITIGFATAKCAGLTLCRGDGDAAGNTPSIFWIALWSNH